MRGHFINVGTGKCETCGVDAETAAAMRCPGFEVWQDIESLRKLMPRGSEVYVINRNTSRSGMMRTLSLLVFVKDGDKMYPLWPYRKVARVIGYSVDEKREGIKVQGAGMDMGFHVVSTLARVLYGDDYALTSRWL